MPTPAMPFARYLNDCEGVPLYWIMINPWRYSQSSYAI